jgi:hypothetical protein
VEKHSSKTLSETDIIKMFQFLINNIVAMLVGRVFQQTVVIPMGTKLCSYFRQHLSVIVLHSLQTCASQGSE